MSDEPIEEEKSLALLFAAAKAADPVPSGDLMARVLADAASAQASSTSNTVAPPRRGVLAVVGGIFGGWAGVSGLAACVCLGVVLGLYSPDDLLNYVPGVEVASSDEAFGLYFDAEY